MSFQSEKALVRAHYDAIAAATPDTVAAALAQHTSADWHWRGMHPFYEQHGAADVAASFWAPFLSAMTKVQRRQDIFIAGTNECDGFTSTWVVSMGHLLGLFDQPFLAIKPTRKISMLRYAEFHRIADGKIVETAMFCDLIHLMRQAGQYPLAPQTGMHLVQPGPATHDGLLFDDADANEGQKTLAVINDMIGDINTHQKYDTPQQELARCWHDDMLWWGPEGIGATYTIDRYVAQHQQPFRRNIKDRVFNGHICRLAEGSFGGFFGWANLSVTNAAGYLGLPAGARSEMRVVDLYRREGDKLAENWIFIDILHYLHLQGLDVLGRMAEMD